LLSAWWSLVGLSVRRQARSRQMVWIALGLLVLAVALVLLNTVAGRWGMHHWRQPRRMGPSYVAWGYKVQALYSVFPNVNCQHAGPTLLLGAYETILSPTAQTTDGRPLAASAFQVFAQSALFSLFLTFLLPIWGLAFATEALGGERESQSLIWLLSRPLPRWSIYLAKFVALLPWSVGLNLVGFALICVSAGPPGWLALRLFWPAVLGATVTFAALFLLIGAYFRRPAVIAIVYSFCLEVVLGNMPGYMKRASVGFYARCLMFEQAELYGIQPDKPNVFMPVEGATAMAVLVGASVALLGLGMWVFSRTQYHEVD
jgi:ABC-type transport system involved in multi-copper enzyme maturation permease subunit